MIGGRWTALACATVLVGTSAAYGSSVIPSLAKVKLPESAVGTTLKGDMKSAVSAKTDEIKQLADDAKRITASIGELAAKGVEAKDDTVAVMQDLVDQLREVNKRLDTLTEEVEGLKGWVEGQNEALPIMSFDINELKRNRNTNYMQFQFRDASGKAGGFAAGRGKQHAMVFRRIRIGLQQTIDPKTRIRLSFDGATGTTNTAFELRDAILDYDIVPSDVRVGTMLSAGQQAIPLGYELARSSGDREFPERATYNRVFFDGERFRGLNIIHGLSDHAMLTAGLGSSLTFNDPEQRGLAAAPGGRMGGHVGFRLFDTNYDFGISHFQGERPELRLGTPTVIHPEFTRRYTYIDGTLVNVLNTGLILRAEGMIGHDRRPIDRTATTGLPTAPRNPADISGYQLQLGYNLDTRNQIFTRYAVTDFNTDTDFNSVKEYGIAYRYFINPGATATLSWETFQDLGATNAAGKNDRVFRVLTARYQFRF